MMEQAGKSASEYCYISLILDDCSVLGLLVNIIDFATARQSLTYKRSPD